LSVASCNCCLHHGAVLSSELRETAHRSTKLTATLIRPSPSMAVVSTPLNPYKYCVDSMVILTNPPLLDYSQLHPLFIAPSPSMTEVMKVLPSPTIPANRSLGPRSHAMVNSEYPGEVSNVSCSISPSTVRSNVHNLSQKPG